MVNYSRVFIKHQCFCCKTVVTCKRQQTVDNGKMLSKAMIQETKSKKKDLVKINGVTKIRIPKSWAH